MKPEKPHGQHVMDEGVGHQKYNRTHLHSIALVCISMPCGKDMVEQARKAMQQD